VDLFVLPLSVADLVWGFNGLSLLDMC